MEHFFWRCGLYTNSHTLFFLCRCKYINLSSIKQDGAFFYCPPQSAVTFDVWCVRVSLLRKGRHPWCWRKTRRSFGKPFWGLRSGLSCHRWKSWSHITRAAIGGAKCPARAGSTSARTSFASTRTCWERRVRPFLFIWLTAAISPANFDGWKQIAWLLLMLTVVGFRGLKRTIFSFST